MAILSTGGEESAHIMWKMIEVDPAGLVMVDFQKYEVGHLIKYL